MAKILDYRGESNVPIVVEDPRATNDGFYLYGEKYDKNTLAPELNKKINFNRAGSDYRGAYNHSNLLSSDDNIQPKYGHRLQLRKMHTCSSSYATGPTSNASTATQDFNPWRTQDTNYEKGRIVEVTDGTNKTIDMNWRQTTSDDGYGQYWSTISDTTYLHEQGSVSDHGRAGFWDTWWTGETETNTGSGGIASYSSSAYQYPNDGWITMGPSQWPGNATTRSISTTNIGTYWHAQHLGKSSVTGKHLYSTTKKQAAADSYINKVEEVSWNATTCTVTTKANFTAIPTASGSSQGGNNLNGNFYNRASSRTFTDPRDSNKKLFYSPYFDSYYNFHPFIIGWDTTNDTFTRETDITVTGGHSSTHFDGANVYSHNHSYGGTTIYNETFESGGNRYITFMYLERGGKLDTTSNLRTWCTYSIGSSDPKALTHHSTVTIPKTANDIVWLNDSRTMLGVLCVGATYIYTFTSGGGWSLATTITENVYDIGRDSLDRIWYVTKSSSFGGGTKPYLNLLTPTLPVTITLVPASTSYTYAGSNVSTSVAVSALNPSGVRIATSVKLVIEGSSMTFADASTVKTVTTLTTGDLTVDTLVTGAGYNNMSASVEI